MKKAIIIGASSGIGRELAKILSQNNYAVGVTARRTDMLQSLQKELSGPSYVKQMDVTDQRKAMKQMDDLIKEMGGLDLIIISAGIGFLNPDLKWNMESNTIAVNVSGFSAIAGHAYKYFQDNKRGHIVGISSLAAIRGSGIAPAYNASKAYASNYLEGLRCKSRKNKSGIYVTDIQPGLVDTAMAKGEGLFWVAPTEKAAKQIYRAIKKRKKVAYVTKRWRLIAWLLRLLPEAIYHKM